MGRSPIRNTHLVAQAQLARVGAPQLWSVWWWDLFVVVHWVFSTRHSPYVVEGISSSTCFKALSNLLKLHSIKNCLMTSTLSRARFKSSRTMYDPLYFCGCKILEGSFLRPKIWFGVVAVNFHCRNIEWLDSWSWIWTCLWRKKCIFQQVAFEILHRYCMFSSWFPRVPSQIASCCPTLDPWWHHHTTW